MNKVYTVIETVLGLLLVAVWVVGIPLFVVVLIIVVTGNPLMGFLAALAAILTVRYIWQNR